MKRFTSRLSIQSVAAISVALVLSACGADNGDQIADIEQTEEGVAAATDGLEETSETSEQLPIGAATNGDFIALRVEAENFSARSGGWALTSHQNTPDIQPDPDPPHHQNASGFANMELLPDLRVTHDDENIGGVSFWAISGSGPTLEYTLDIPEPGKYMVWVKSFSTGTEDNGIHVGLNGEATPSGERIQWCGGKNQWTWSSAQRVDANHCGVAKTIFLDIPDAGNNTIVFYAREDGFEIDQFLLIKDTTGNADCEPLANDQISCKSRANGQHTGTFSVPLTRAINGNSVGDPPPQLINIDMDLDMSANRQSALIGDAVEYTVKLTNTDTGYTATDVTAQITIDSKLSFQDSADCTATGSNTIECDTAEMAPSSSRTLQFSVLVNEEGSPRVDAQVTIDQSDPNPGNNAESISIATSPAIPDYDGALTTLASPNVLGIVDTKIHLVEIQNIGLQTISGAMIEIQGDANIHLQALLESETGSCTDTSPINCSLADVAAGSSLLIPVTVTPLNGGSAAITSILTVAGDEDNSNNSDSTLILVRDEPIASISDIDLSVEAENFYSQALHQTPDNGPQIGWSVNTGNVKPKIKPDFDEGDNANASLEGYVELLPDNRISAQDPLIEGQSNFTNGGESSVLTYRVFVDKAGRYYVNARIRANNSEDATIHVGLNDIWPDTTRSISVCNPDGNWQWTNSQQTSGACDPSVAAFVDIASPGFHTIAVSAGTDGVELDKLVLRFGDPALPQGTGTESVSFTMPNLDLAIAGTIKRAKNPTDEQARTYEVTVYNLDEVNTAFDITVRLEGLNESHAATITGFDSCISDSSSASASENANDSEVIECKIPSLAPGSSSIASVGIDKTEREVRSDVTVAAATDTDATNNTSVATYGGGGLSMGFLSLLFLTQVFPVRKKTLAIKRSHRNDLLSDKTST